MFDAQSEKNFEESEEHFLDPDYKFPWERTDAYQPSWTKEGDDEYGSTDDPQR